MSEEVQPHTQLTTAINTDRAIIMGDPARVDKAAFNDAGVIVPRDQERFA